MVNPYIEQISNNQACTCLTKVRYRSVAFVPQHVRSTGAKWSATVESSQCFLVARQLDVQVYGNAHQVFEVQICTIFYLNMHDCVPRATLQSYHHQYRGTLVLSNFQLSKFWVWMCSNLNRLLTFDFAPACMKAALFGAQAMWDQNIS